MLAKQLWDDVLLQPVELPRVISPCKNVFEKRDVAAGNLVPTFNEHMFSMISGGYEELCMNNSLAVRRKLNIDFAPKDAEMKRKGEENLVDE